MALAPAPHAVAWFREPCVFIDITFPNYYGFRLSVDAGSILLALLPLFGLACRGMSVVMYIREFLATINCGKDFMLWLCSSRRSAHIDANEVPMQGPPISVDVACGRNCPEESERIDEIKTFLSSRRLLYTPHGECYHFDRCRALRKIPESNISSRRLCTYCAGDLSNIME